MFGRIQLEGVFTEEVQGKIGLKEDRPVLLLTSTSYTPDEDLGLLLKALVLYADRARQDGSLPRLHLIVTGAGPLKKQFIKHFEEFNRDKSFGKVKIETKWLEIDDYPRMVAAADLGICMHMSSSNLDLPMKVVDMFSCQLPCFAYDYPTIGELVHSSGSQPNGALFKAEKDLYELLTSHFSGGVDKAIASLKAYSDNLESFTKETWEDHWNEVMLAPGANILE